MGLQGRDTIVFRALQARPDARETRFKWNPKLRAAPIVIAEQA
jgi:hypothetical protein